MKPTKCPAREKKRRQEKHKVVLDRLNRWRHKGKKGRGSAGAVTGGSGANGLIYQLGSKITRTG